jgi:hypothetical protein
VTLTPNQAFVAQVYLDLLHHPVEGAQPADALPGGGTTWGGLPNDPAPLTRASRAFVAWGIADSSEHRALVIQDDCQKFLRRAASDFADPDPANKFDGQSLQPEVGT